MPDVFQRFEHRLRAVLAELAAAGILPEASDSANFTVEPPRDRAHGDIATNVAMALASAARQRPRDVAETIAARLAGIPAIAAASVANPGFINVALERSEWTDELRTILDQKDRYGRAEAPTGRTVNVEYVSANPTGPMHMGHCRGAVVGDALANILEANGDSVIREYYINDAGAQVDHLARSVHARYLEALGRPLILGEGLYPGEYLKPVGAALAEEFGPRFAEASEAEWLPTFRDRSISAMMDLIREDLGTLGIRHNRFSSEAALQSSGATDRALAALTAKDLVYEGVLPPPKGELKSDWEPVELLLFKASELGDDQDRPLKKSDGSWTYFGADIAYHLEKARTADALVNIWGADHSGTVKRLVSAFEALTDGKQSLDIKLVSLVHLFRDGAPVRMSKRAGEFLTLRDVVDEVGKDVVRFIMLTRRAEAGLDFDFTKVVSQSKDNPVFYVQYAHARIQSLLRRVGGLDGMNAAPSAFGRLDAAELALVKVAAEYPRVVRSAGQTREPHRVAFYLMDLAAAFHALWNRGNDDADRRFLIEDDADLTRDRVLLAAAVAQVIRNGLGLLGVAAIDEMR